MGRRAKVVVADFIVETLTHDSAYWAILRN